MTDPTLVTFLWKGWRPVYDARHVNALHRMLRTHSPGLKLVCITDAPQGIECETHPIWPSPVVLPAGERNSYVRLRLFDPKVGKLFGERVVNIDLDCIILNDIRPLFAENYGFRAVRGLRSPINGSMWMIRSGTNAHVWRDFHAVRSPQAISKAIRAGKTITGSDQAWMSLAIKSPATWGPEDGVQQFSRFKPHSLMRVLFFAGANKPWDTVCRDRCPGAYETYHRHFV